MQIRKETMSKVVQFVKPLGKEPIAWVTIDNPPMNALGDQTKEGLEMESRAWGSLFDSKEQKEGAQAFLERRTPKFRGE
jgi:enoyl-CoA hydratase/carnithine racemase